MEDKIYTDENRIDQYLMGKMTPDEERAFEADLKNNPSLKKQAEFTARMAIEMDEAGKEHDMQMIEMMKASSSKIKKPTVWLSIAASLALLLTIGYNLYDYSATTSLGREYANTFQMSELIRGEENEDVANTITELFDNVSKGKDLKNTVTRLESLWQMAQSDTYNEYTTYAPYIGWNLAVAQLQRGHKKKAKIVLEEIKSSNFSGSILREESDKLLKRL